MDSNFDHRVWEPDPGEAGRRTPPFDAIGLLLVAATVVAVFIVFVMNAEGHSADELDQFMRQWGMGP